MGSNSIESSGETWNLMICTPKKKIHTDHREENPVMLLIISSQRNCFYEKCFLFTEILYYQILITKDFEKYKIWK